MKGIWNTDFTNVVPDGAEGGEHRTGLFFTDGEGRIRRVTQAVGHEIGYNPETEERKLIAQESPSTVIKSYHLTIDKDIVIKKGDLEYAFFNMFRRLRPTGDNAKVRIYLVDFRDEEIGKDHNKYYAETMMATVTVNSVNETDGILSVNFAQDGDYTTGVMGRTDDGTLDDEAAFTYGFTPSNLITITGIKVSKDAVAIPAGGEARVAVSFSPLGCPYDFTVKSSDPKIAAVSRWNQSVDIKGREIGAATITITSTADITAEAEIEVAVS